MFIIMSIQHNYSFVVSIKMSKYESLKFVLLLQGCFGYSGFFEFTDKSWDQLVKFGNKASWKFDKGLC